MGPPVGWHASHAGPQCASAGGLQWLRVSPVQLALWGQCSCRVRLSVAATGGARQLRPSRGCTCNSRPSYLRGAAASQQHPKQQQQPHHKECKTMSHQDNHRTSYPPVYSPWGTPAPAAAATKPLRPAKLAGHQFPAELSDQLPAGAQQLHRRLLLYFGLYALLLVVLSALYAAYYFCFHQSHLHALDSAQIRGHLLDFSAPATGQPQARHSDDTSERLENKLVLLERYIELLASELQGLNGRLREREKCDCALSCSFNGTKFAQGSSWQSQCDVCTCQSGRIMCTPQKCPPLSCDEPVLVPGQCCATCLRSCKYNSSLIKHGKKFTAPGSKECRCHDGRIRCETGQKVDSPASSRAIPRRQLNATRDKG